MLTQILGNRNLIKNRNFSQRFKFHTKIEMPLKNQNFPQKSKFSSNIEILPGIEILLGHRNFDTQGSIYH